MLKTGFNSTHLILPSHVEDLLPASLCLVALLSFEQSSQFE